MSAGRISKSHIWELAIQRFLGWIFLLPYGLAIVAVLKFYYRYSVRDIRQIRKQFAEISKSGSPLVICPNHLTMIDSLIIMWVLAPIPYYFLHYRLFCWNIPAIENYRDKILWRLIAYLGKCIPIDRNGSQEHIDGILGKLAFLIGHGNACMIFPEGTRSRTGRINPDSASYGIGKLLKAVPGCQVLCVYLRGEQQETYSMFPRRGEVFTMKMELLTPSSTHSGLRAIKDFSVQIISKLYSMEQDYFARRR